MKLFNIFFTLCLILSFLACETEKPETANETEISNCDCNHLKLDNKYNRFYLTDKKHPFNGQCTVLNTGGQVISERHFVEGKYHGDYINYYENGEIQSLKTYKNHFLNGDYKEFTPKGELINHSIYKQSTLIETIEYHPELYQQH